jgi:hypothetical protein
MEVSVALPLKIIPIHLPSVAESAPEPQEEGKDIEKRKKSGRMDKTSRRGAKDDKTKRFHLKSKPQKTKQIRSSHLLHRP